MAEELLAASVEPTPAAVEAPAPAVPEVPAEPPAPPTVEELAKRLEETTKQYEDRIKRMEEKTLRRIGAVVAKKNELRDRLFAIEGNNLSQQTFKEPTLAEYNGNAEQFVKARDDYKQNTAAHEQAKQQFEQARISAEVGESVEILRENMADTLTVEEVARINAANSPTTPDMLRYMASVPEGTKVALHLADYPKDAEFIARLPSAADRAGALLHLAQAIRTGSIAPQTPPAARAPLAPAVAAPPPPPVARGASARPADSSSRAYYESLQQERIARAKAHAKK